MSVALVPNPAYASTGLSPIGTAVTCEIPSVHTGLSLWFRTGVLVQGGFVNYKRETSEPLVVDPAAIRQEVVDRLRMIGRFGDYLDAGTVQLDDALLLAKCLLEKAEGLTQ
jgi:hypothetical protein